MLDILKRKVKDERFLKLLKGMLKAGYMEDWTYHKTYSGTPQGGIVSPLLANIVLNELDAFVEDTLIPKYTTGKRRKVNPEYQALECAIGRARRKGDVKAARMLKQKLMKTPSKMANDEEFRRLKYVRYADDTLWGYIGSKQEVTQIQEDIRRFLKTLRLDLSADKTVITHALTEKARFLNYDICYIQTDQRVRISKKGYKRRSANGKLYFSIPPDVVNAWKRKVSKRGKVIHRKDLQNREDYDIVFTYNVELQGLINYYSLAHNVYDRMSQLRYVWETSLAKSLASKHKTTVNRIFRKYKRFPTSDGRNIIGVEIPRDGKAPLRATFGMKPIERKHYAVIQDEIQIVYGSRNEVVSRLLAEKCELCGRAGNVEGHHIKKLKDLKERWKGRREKPEWVKRMIAIRRKTLFVCETCHKQIHRGLYDGQKLTQA
jgi:hypothetical protein